LVEKDNEEPACNAAERPTWDEYFLQMAKLVSTRSVCFRMKCGAVIVKDKFVVSTGYNGAPAFQQNCAEIGYCYRDQHHIKSGTELERCRACGSHSESNAVAIAARLGNATAGATMFVYGNRFVCTQCKGIIANAGILRVLHRDVDGFVHEYLPESDWNVHPVDQENP
jgi:dCMP deaminase